MWQINLKKEAYIIHSKSSDRIFSVPPAPFSKFDVNPEYTSKKYNQKNRTNEYYCQLRIYKGKKQN